MSTDKHQLVYTSEYFINDVEGPAAFAAPIISASILTTYAAKRVIDVGCGTGALLQAFDDNGCSCIGLEYADAAIQECTKRGLEVVKFDIEKDRLPSNIGHFDVAISMEVAEHLPQRHADRFVKLLSRLSDCIILTAATPGQGGTDHVNEQPHEYWIEKFERVGYCYEDETTQSWRNSWGSKNLADFYQRNLMIFQRPS